jgi:alpha-1,3-rhamnosyl/mannosyltransferase
MQKALMNPQSPISPVIGVDGYNLTDGGQPNSIRHYLTEILRFARPEIWGNELHCITKQVAQSPLEAIKNPSLSWDPTAGGSFTWRHLNFKKAAKELGLDAVWFPCHAVPFLYTLPNVVTLHDISFILFPEMGDWKGNLYHSLMLWRSLSQASHMISVSQFTADEVMKKYRIPAKRITVIHHGVTKPPEMESRKSQDEALRLIGISDRFFLFLDGTKSRKNLQFLLSLLQDHPKKWLGEYQFVITGNETTLRQMITMAGLGEWVGTRIILPGFIPDSTLDTLFRNATALLYLSLYEGFGFPAIEAFSRKCPVVALNASSVPEVAGDAAIYVNPGDQNGLGEAMNSVGQENVRQQMIRLGEKEILRFDWQRASDTTGEVISMVAKNGF